MIYTYMKNVIIFIILFFINFPIFAKNLSNLELKIIGNKNLDFESVAGISVRNFDRKFRKHNI